MEEGKGSVVKTVKRKGCGVIGGSMISMGQDWD